MSKYGTAKIATVAFVCFGFLSACKKDGHENTPPLAKNRCRVVYFTTNVRDTSFITYNSNGSINSIRETIGSVTSYTYTGNIVTLNKTGPTGFEFRTIVTVNSIGLATNVRMEFNSQGTNWTNAAYQYNGDQVSRAIVTLSNPTIVDTGNITWQNGNPVSVSDGASVSHNDFDPNISHQPGDYFSLVQLLTGFEVTRPKNLIKSQDQTEFSYVFSADGHISSITQMRPNADAMTNGFVYECY